MSRQTFLTRDFFVPAKEESTRQLIMDLPTSIPYLTFLSENKSLQSIRFLYAPANEKSQYLMEVLWLPLNHSFTKVTLRGAYVDGSAFYDDRYIANVLYNAETAIMAMAEGRLEEFQVELPDSRKSSFTDRVTLITATLSGLMFNWKKLF
jgi:hypothetical protein